MNKVVNKHQRGYIYLKSGTFFVRYRGPKIIEGKLGRGQLSHELCKKSDKYFSRKCTAVRLKCEEFMRGVNTADPSRTDMTVADFWRLVYLPFIEKPGNMEDNTVDGYKQVWNQHLKPHFGEDITLRDYRPHMGTAFLSTLIRTPGSKMGYAKNTVASIRSLASGIFSHALALGHLELNPWSGVKILGKQAESPKTPHWTMDEVEGWIAGLEEKKRRDGQALIGLGFYVGLRPNELRALRLEDFNFPESMVHVKRGITGKSKVKNTLKSPSSVAVLPVPEPAMLLLKAWIEQCGNPSTGWVFSNRKGKPKDMRSLINQAIRPILGEEVAAKVRQLYAARRGTATSLSGLTGDVNTAKEVLRQKHPRVTVEHYIKEIPDAAKNGMQALGAKGLTMRAAARAKAKAVAH
jgi:integrase